jgi:thymidylate synthase
MNNNSRILYGGFLLELYRRLSAGKIVEVRGSKTVEIINATESFDATEDGLINIKDIFVTSKEYIDKEMEWYLSQNPNVSEIKKHAKIWEGVSDENDMANSNYGFLVFSPQNGNQFKNVVKELKKDPHSRRACIYYTNPMMHYVGGNDHVCTVYVSYSVRDGKLSSCVSMRSNDVRFGLIGADLAWQIYVLRAICKETGYEPGNVNWHSASLHIYERHFKGLRDIFE